jgi:hypothetical protein
MNRRHVLRHAVKLVYATPLIVATMSTRQDEALAQLCTCPIPTVEGDE